MACLFCRIATGEIPAQIVYSSPDVTVFRDINPQAPTHVLVVPNRHVESFAELGAADAALLGRLVEVTNEVARREHIADGGFRVVVNSGENAGQTVSHLHFHLLGGRTLTWPPG
jgi:histidine triad (HIT) family protein